MKKTFAMLMLIAMLFSSCEKMHLNSSGYGDDFKRNNSVLYMNEACDHFLIYSEADDSANGIDPNVYHVVYCKWGTCREKRHYEPHTLRIGNIGSARSQYKENGYMYHAVSLTCARCDAVVTLHLLCGKQELSCLNVIKCYDTIRWEEILCDMPYEISCD